MEYISFEYTCVIFTYIKEEEEEEEDEEEEIQSNTFVFHTCRADVGYMNLLPLMAGCPPVTDKKECMQ